MRNPLVLRGGVLALDFLVSNCSWRDGQLRAEFRQPFDSLADSAMAAATVAAAGGSDQAKREIWLGRRDSNPNWAVQSRLSYH